MPEFVLDYGTTEGETWYKSLDSFTRGYVEAMFFTCTGTGDDEESGLETASVDDLAPQAREDIAKECADWQEANAALLDLAYARQEYDPEQAGRDYWYTRNGHGVGFWDRTVLDADGLGDKLSAAARYSDRYLTRGDDGLIYYEG